MHDVELCVAETLRSRAPARAQKTAAANLTGRHHTTTSIDVQNVRVSFDLQLKQEDNRC